MVQTDMPADQGAARQRLRLWVQILKATRHVESELRDRLRREYDTTLPRFDVLAALHGASEGMKMTELSRQLMVSSGNVTGIVDRLVADGLALREADATDRRAFRVSITAAGRDLMGRMLVSHQAWIDELFAGVAEHDVARGVSIMMDIRRKSRE